MIRFPFQCGDASSCEKRTFADARRNCMTRGGSLCRGNAATTSKHDPSCPGNTVDYVWTLTKCEVNDVPGRIIRPSAGGENPVGQLCETNLLALHQSRCCSNVC